MPEQGRASSAVASPREHVAAIDGLRAVAVLLVVVQHTMPIPRDIGSRGVQLFFVVSGFCLAMPVLRRAAAGLPARLDRRAFYLGRLRRIAPPYYVALTLFALLALTPFGTPTFNGPIDAFEYPRSLAFVDGYFPAYNGSFWTLEIEARWYLLFPLLLALYARSRLLVAMLGIAASVVYFRFAPLMDLGQLPCFLLGIAAADLYVRRRLRGPAVGVAAAVLVAAAIAAPFDDSTGGPLWQLAAFAVVLAALGPLRRAFSPRPLCVLGVASYSIYLVHFPFACTLHFAGLPPVVVAPVVVAIGLAFFYGVERPLGFLVTRRTTRAAGREASAAPAAPGIVLPVGLGTAPSLV